jgi:Kdo2-lipid IVA lauroyltransferase/acyltransferase
MAKVRRPALDYLVYLVVRGVVAFVQGLPLAWAVSFSELLAWLIHRVDKRHRKVAAENLRFAFPEKSTAEIDALVWDCYRHFLLVIIEIAVLPRKLRVENWRNFASMVTSEPVVRGLLVDRPLLIVTGHFGNWELAGFALGALGFKTFAIARVLDNPHLEKFLKQFRQATGQTIIAKKDDFERLTVAMQTGGKVATLADQDAGTRGVFVPFFGRMASAHKAVALMALEFNARIVVIGVPRVGGVLQYHIQCEDSFDAADYADRPDAVKAITERYHQALERLIRRHPEQYFWLHRRWKTEPRPANRRRESPG